MAEKHIFLVPTDGTVQEFLNMTFGHRQPTPEERRQQEEWIKPHVAQTRDRLQRARKLGVPIAAGSDMYLTVPDENRGQASLDLYDALAEEGMMPLETSTPPPAMPQNCWDGRPKSERSKPESSPTSSRLRAIRCRT